MNKETITHYAKAYKAYKDDLANNFAFNGHHNDHNIYLIMKVYWHITTRLLLHTSLKMCLTDGHKPTQNEVKAQTERYYLATYHQWMHA